jgi:hypothetical protein
MMVQGAPCILRTFAEDSDLRRWDCGLPSAEGKRPKRSIVVVARKLAVLLHKLWVSGDVYELLRNSLQADYASLIDKRQLDSLKKIREAIRRNHSRSPRTSLMHTLAWARRIISSEVSQYSSSFSPALSGSSGSRSPSITWSLPAAVCEDHAGAGGPARENTDLARVSFKN